MHVNFLSTYSDKKSCHTSTTLQTSIARFVSDSWASCFVSPGDVPAIITQYVAWMVRQFNACQTPRSMYLSIFNSFRVIRCLTQCISPKVAQVSDFGLFSPYKTPKKYLLVNGLQPGGYIVEWCLGPTPIQNATTWRVRSGPKMSEIAQF